MLTVPVIERRTMEPQETCKWTASKTFALMQKTKIDFGNNIASSIKLGYCQCGCGQKTKIGTDSNPSNKFLNHHHIGNWKGGKTLDTRGYEYTKQKDHPRANKENYVLTSILVAEKALGHYLPLKAVVHHVDGKKLNNADNNLVACQNQAFHQLLHERQKALEACGDSNKRQCPYCHKYDFLKNFYNNKKNHYHRDCYNKNRNKKRSK